MATKIRPYQTNDFDACCAIYDSNVPQFFRDHERPAFHDYLRRFTAENYWVLEVDGSVLGCGGIAVEPGGLGKLCFGLVRQDHHRQGLGAVLTRYRLRKLLEHPEVTKIEIHTSQHTAGFYLRFGFTHLSTTENEYGPGLHRVDMRLDLAAPQKKNAPIKNDFDI